MNQKIFIKTFGCQMNEYDSNRIYDSVKKIGFEKTEKYEFPLLDFWRFPRWSITNGWFPFEGRCR